MNDSKHSNRIICTGVYGYVCYPKTNIFSEGLHLKGLLLAHDSRITGRK